MAEGGSGPLDDLADSLDDKVGGVPVWVIGLGLGLLIGLVWWFYNNRSGDGATARVFDPESAEEPAEEDPQNSDYGLPNGPIGDWLADNPGSSAYPTNQNSLPITNAQWSRYIADTFLSKGDDPTIVTNALTKYLKGAYLTVEERAVINRALDLMVPPEGLLAINTTPPAPTAMPAPSGLTATNTRTSIKAKWTAVPGSGGYKVYVNNVFRQDTLGPSTTIAFLKPGSSYSIGVAAVPRGGGAPGPRSTRTFRTAR